MNADHQQPRDGLVRGLGLLQATALNMSNMVGIGPFITIPLIIASMGGPQCMLGWALGALLALCDGLVWSELAAALPGSGGTYLYLRESFAKAGLPAEIEVYEGTLHGWCPPDSQVYNEAQAEKAWSRLLALFGKALA